MNAPLTVGSLFSGIGLLDLGLCQAGLEHRWFCEADPWRRGILAKRWPGVPIFDDVRTVGARNAERVDVIAGGFPCQPFSTAGSRKRWDDQRWLWPEFLRVIAEAMPRYVVVENVPGLLAGEWIDEPDDRCICGCPRGWGGMRLRGQGAQSASRCGHGDESPSGADLDGDGVRGCGEESECPQGPLVGRVLLDAVRDGGGELSAPHRASVALEGGASTSGDPRRRDPAGDAKEGPWGRLDPGCERSDRADSNETEGAESSWSDDGGLAGGGDCPACGRPMGESPTRHVLRSGFHSVLGGLAACGFDVEWDHYPSAAFGAPHLRDRVIAIAAHADRGAWRDEQLGVANRLPEGPHAARPRSDAAHADGRGRPGEGRGWPLEPDERPAGADHQGQPAGVAADADEAGRGERGRRVAGGAQLAATERDRADAPDASGLGTARPGGDDREGADTRREPPGRGSTTIAGGRRQALADTDGGRQPEQPQRDSEQRNGLDRAPGHDPQRRGVRVEWGAYEPAIRRWEAIHGPAPAPLIELRRVDDGSARRVERSRVRVERQRLSALGDGVQVNLGRLVGEHLMELVRGHMR